MAATGDFSGARYQLFPVTLGDGTTAYAIGTVSVDSSGNAAGAGNAANPTVTKSQGSGSLATSQAASSVSPAAATQIVAARTGRQAVTITNITGTQPVYFTATAATTGVTTGFFLAGAAGASVTIATAAAIFATSPTAAQTLAVLETF